ncbi:hemerythrin domain-containing protein [Nocardioides sp. zg-1230]|uniref:hemerythrin domain-containing protein n=1 Tax=Nocardioides sp. zg-1230 TaxID=2736601 RepID=UPI001556F672|nr:hemerythrin domain-containing protein [Nocardioides sp. zg-1230]NPC41043.1 hemerythrin domain-containing protein [Nocardioides sp. zg-1230]
MKHTETSTTSYRPQLTLPRQAHTAEGPHDQTGMYVMHHALRRDFARFVSAVESTPVAEHDVWIALERRWVAMADVLHHHHSAEDAELWPLLQRHAEAAGDEADLQVLADMEDEHADIDPALAHVRDAFAAMSRHPCIDHRNALEIRLGAAHELLLAHLAHEEKHALPMLQRTLSQEENAAFEKAVEKHYPLRLMPFTLPWVMDEIPADARERLLESTPPGYGLLLRIFRRRYQRGERLAFRFA